MRLLTYYVRQQLQPNTSPEERANTYAKTRGKKVTITTNSLGAYEYNNTVIQFDDVDIPTNNRYTHDLSAHAAIMKCIQEYNALSDDDKAYQTVTIPKRSGGRRELKIPSESLKGVQRNMVRCMNKDVKILEHDNAYGFVKRRNCKKALQKHVDNDSLWFYKTDISNFFPSITNEMIVNTFYTILEQSRYTSLENLRQIVQIFTDENEKLTQGSPSSPFISNLVMLEFDYKISNYCTKRGMVYTRYADDILISSRTNFKKTIDISEVIKDLFIECALPFQLSESKTRYGSRAGKNWNLGILYNQQGYLSVGHKQKNLMKVIAHKWETVDNKPHWIGILAYYKSIEPEYFNQERFEVIK